MWQLSNDWVSSNQYIFQLRKIFDQHPWFYPISGERERERERVEKEKKRLWNYPPKESSFPTQICTCTE